MRLCNLDFAVLVENHLEGLGARECHGLGGVLGRFGEEPGTE